MRRTMSVCLAGLLLFSGCSLPALHPMTPPAARRGTLPPGWGALTEKGGGLADPGAQLDLGAGLTVLDEGTLQADQAACATAERVNAGRVVVSAAVLALGAVSLAFGGPFVWLWIPPDTPPGCGPAPGDAPAASGPEGTLGATPPGL